eukprot:GHVU01120086.1.p2 GENE.GHVU01120086.1~~GHVU01120086.1.p2  ORF type:complete len:310 (-),score=43.17 GHVU01120086.1:78-872(-)
MSASTPLGVKDSDFSPSMSASKPLEAGSADLAGALKEEVSPLTSATSRGPDGEEAPGPFKDGDESKELEPASRRSVSSTGSDLSRAPPEEGATNSGDADKDNGVRGASPKGFKRLLPNEGAYVTDGSPLTQDALPEAALPNEEASFETSVQRPSRLHCCSTRLLSSATLQDWARVTNSFLCMPGGQDLDVSALLERMMSRDISHNDRPCRPRRAQAGMLAHVMTLGGICNLEAIGPAMTPTASKVTGRAFMMMADMISTCSERW